MKRKKNLERAIVLGLILSTGVYGTAWAEELGAVDATKNDKEYITNTTYTITTTGNTNGINVGSAHSVVIGSEQNNKVNTVTINAAGSALASRTGGGTVTINANDEIVITGNSTYAGALSAGYAGTQYLFNSSNVSIKGNNGGAIVIGSSSATDAKIKIIATGNDETKIDDIVNNITSSAASGTVNLAAGELNITAEKGSNYIESTAGSGYGIKTSNTSVVNITADNGKNIVSSKGNAIEAQGNRVTLTALSNEITSNNRGVYAYKNDGTYVEIKSVGTNANSYNKVYGMFTGLYAGGENETGYSEINEIKLFADNGKNIIIQGNKDRTWTNTSDAGIYAAHNGKVTMTALANEITADTEGVEGYLNSDITITATNGDNTIKSNWSGIRTNYQTKDEDYLAKIKLVTKNGDNIIESGKDINLGTEIDKYQNEYHGYGINARYSSDIELSAYGNNIIKAGKIDTKNYGNGIAIGTGVNTTDSSKTSVTLEAAYNNELSGAVYATAYSKVNLQGLTFENNKFEATNIVRSAAVIDGAGGLAGKDEDSENGLDVVSALYAENGAQINISGINDLSTYYSDPSDLKTSERVVWAYDTADINIDGYTNISTTLYNESPNSKDIAIAAGTGTNLDADKVNSAVSDRATVTLIYDNYTDTNGNEYVSHIEGDILSAYEGLVDISAKDGSSAGIAIEGNLLAGNNGILNVDLGKGGVLTGRADDYGDAGVIANSGHGTTENKDGNTFFDPAFSSDIYKGGEVNLTMGEGSRWNVTGQSWITTINTNDTDNNAENNAFIDLVSANTDRNSTAHALTVYEMNGNATFNMSLDRNRDTSDMLYIKNAQGDYIVNVVDAVTTDDMYANGFNGLRFATVGIGSNASFRAVTVDQGVLNVEYEVDTDSYHNNTENDAYNGSNISEHKPGSDIVDGLFESTGEPGSTANGNAANNITLLDESDAVEEAVAEDSLTETTNFKLVARKGEELSDGGKAVLNMSRANYSNAIYMDRLNKRLGEARYINDDPEEDEGMWVRIRHDRIGKDDAFRSQNTMYELGYDKRQECDNGKRRVGFAVDYMHGDTGYSDISGKGEIDRYGLWLYDTWTGNKGHYADYVAKWGHLDNEFEIFAPTTGEKINGDYSNNVFSISAEYGRKKDIGNDWYFEPQVQAQLARVTGADYTTSQGTKVSVDGINSLIGRAGFRLGKDFGEEKQSTLYFKADVLHEFLGDQDIRALDSTTNGNWSTISYENEGTWYDIGIGYAAMLSQSTYAFVDLEKSFGHDNDDTYQINAGVRWTF